MSKISQRGTKYICYALIALAAWATFIFCLTTHQSDEIIRGVGWGAGLLSFFALVAISEEKDNAED